MPDVHVLYRELLFQPQNASGIQRRLQDATAEQMDCLDDDGTPIVHDPRTQIDILTFQPISGLSSKAAAIQVLAYDWPDRMRNIAERLANIGMAFAEAVGDVRGDIAMSFVPLPRGEFPRGCWVKVTRDT